MELVGQVWATKPVVEAAAAAMAEPYWHWHALWATAELMAADLYPGRPCLHTRHRPIRQSRRQSTPMSTGVAVLSEKEMHQEHRKAVAEVVEMAEKETKLMVWLPLLEEAAE